MGPFGRRSDISVPSWYGGERARRFEGKKETLSSSDALDAYIVAAAQRRGGRRRQFPFGDGVARQTGLGHAKPDMARLRRPLNPNRWVA